MSTLMVVKGLQGRKLAVVVAVVALAAGSTAVAFQDPLNLGTRRIALVPLTVTIALIVVGTAAMARSGEHRFTALAPATMILIIGGVLEVMALFLSGGGRDVSHVRSTDGYELVVVEGDSFMAIDAIYDVRLRHRLGPFTQETVVWRGHEEGPAPKTVRFAGENTVELVTGDGCEYRSVFDRRTLTPRPAHESTPEEDCPAP